MNLKKNKINVALVCFYLASKGGNGAAEVTLGMYNSIKERKKLFEIDDRKVNIKIINLIFKIYQIFKISLKMSKFFKSGHKNIVIIEGASWVGFSFIFFILSKLFIKKIKYVYHSHNIEYDIRHNHDNNFLIIFLTKVFEKYIFKNCDYTTVVSADDQKRIKKLYNINSSILENGIDIKRLKIKKPHFKLPKFYFMFIGSYWFKPNKEALEYIFKELLKEIRNFDKNIAFIMTGDGFPTERLKYYKNIIYLKNLNKYYLNYLILNADYLLFPMKKRTGTKLKIIESLMIGGNIVTSKGGIKGIDIKFKNFPYIYKNKTNLLKILKRIKKNKKEIKKRNSKFAYYYKVQYDMSKILYHFINKTNLYDFK